MPELTFPGLIWLIAGVGLGIALSMVFLALVLEVDRRRVRRRLRPVAALATGQLPDAVAVPELVVAKPESARPERKAVAPRVNAAGPPRSPPSSTMSVAPPKAAVEAPGEPPAKPLSVEEMFEKAFKVADLPKPPPEQS
jgi:hypothetical protein